MFISPVRRYLPTCTNLWIAPSRIVVLPQKLHVCVCLVCTYGCVHLSSVRPMSVSSRGAHLKLRPWVHMFSSYLPAFYFRRSKWPTFVRQLPIGHLHQLRCGKSCEPSVTEYVALLPVLKRKVVPVFISCSKFRLAGHGVSPCCFEVPSL